MNVPIPIPSPPAHHSGSLQCPTCSSIALAPTQLEFGLPALGCGGCGGAAISLLSYRAWQAHTCVLDAAAVQAPAVAESTRALKCPRCHHIMRKYRVTVDSECRVDLCSACDEVWFDAGEWPLLIALRLHDRLGDILSEPWQTRLRREQATRQYEARYLELLGARDYDVVRKLREWMRRHPLRKHILEYLARGER